MWTLKSVDKAKLVGSGILTDNRENLKMLKLFLLIKTKNCQRMDAKGWTEIVKENGSHEPEIISGSTEIKPVANQLSLNINLLSFLNQSHILAC